MESLKEQIMYIVGDFKIDASLTAEQRAEKILKLFENHLSNLWDKNRKILVYDAALSDDFKEGYDEAINDIITNIIISESQD